MFNLTNYDETISNQNLSQGFQDKLAELKPTVESMVDHLSNFKKQRMVVIGELQEWSNITPNGHDKSAVKRLLSHFSTDVVKDNVAAYRAYKGLKGNVNQEFKALAEAATPSQLKVLSRGENTTVAHDAAMVLKRTGKVPTFQELNNIVMGRSNYKPPVQPQVQPVSEPVQPYVAPSPEEQAMELEFRRCNINDPSQKSHIKGLINNSGLPLIDSVKKSYFWYTDSQQQASLACIEQRMMQSPAFAEQVMNLAAKYSQPKNSEDVTDAVVEVKASAAVFDNKERNGVRWRR